MKIGNLRSEKTEGRVRVAATVSWEDCSRPVHELYFETEEEFGEGLTCNPHAFLVGCVMPAMHHREKRIYIDGEICPELKDNLITAMNLIRHWYYGPDRGIVRIEAKTGTGRTGTRPRAGFFFSGGIDCLATLRSNRISYPPEHPGWIRDGLLIYGQNVESDNRPETFAEARSELSDLAAESGVVLIPVYTNVRLLDDDPRVFDVNHGAILGAVAHAFSRRLTTVYIAASDSIGGLSLVNCHSLKPHGSHPLLDPCYGSSDLKIRHDGITLSRLDKTRLIADWDTALRNIRVCGPNWPGRNCGRCEKCVRTMLELLAADVLDRSGAFPSNDVSAGLIAGITIKKPRFGYTVDDDYLELIAPLRGKGRHDLADAIERMLERPHLRRGLISIIREIDRQYLSGVLSRTKKLLYAPSKGETDANREPQI